jgi:hypothetical protein
MIKSTKRFTFFVLACSTTAMLLAQERMRPGLWENTVTSGGKSDTRSHCLTADELATTNGSIEAIRQSMVKAFAKLNNGTCALKDFKVDGSTISSLMVCGSSSFASTRTFHGDTVDTASTSTTAGVARVSHITSRRLGACPATDK